MEMQNTQDSIWMGIILYVMTFTPTYIYLALFLLKALCDRCPIFENVAKEKVSLFIGLRTIRIHRDIMERGGNSYFAKFPAVCRP